MNAAARCAASSTASAAPPVAVFAGAPLLPTGDWFTSSPADG